MGKCDFYEELFRKTLLEYSESSDWFMYARRLRPTERKSGEVQEAYRAVQESAEALRGAIIDLVKCEIKGE